MYAYQKKPEQDQLFDRCYPFNGMNPPKFYKTMSGECVHMHPKCHGLRNRKSAVMTYRVCLYCHQNQMHNAMRLIPAGAGRRGQDEMSAGLEPGAEDM